MDKEMTRGRALLFLISLFLTNVAVMADMVIIPAGNGLYETCLLYTSPSPRD